MAKIGTAHVEIKPVLNEEALDQIVQRIEKAVEDGVYRALVRSQQKIEVSIDGKSAGRIYRVAKDADEKRR